MTHERINIGMGEDLTIRELAELAMKVVRFDGELVFDAAKPDGTPQKLMDVAKLHKQGWHHTVSPRRGNQFSVGDGTGAVLEPGQTHLASEAGV